MSTAPLVLSVPSAPVPSVPEININVQFTKRLGAGFFGGEGFILERLEGDGDVFIHSGGTTSCWS